ncbi:MAG: sensor histidine kinase [Clostridiales bacterium]|nr:sensor histidine kinase [Clostridiales bacterium]
MKGKILSIVTLGVSVTVLTALMVIGIFDEAYQKLLYQTLSESLSYSSKDISAYLDGLEQLTMMLLSDDNIQTDLTIIQEEPQESIKSMNAMRRIRSTISMYYQSTSDGILRYITLYTKGLTAHTNILRSDETPKRIQNEIIRRANEKDGAPSWVADYMDDYGLMLGRDINRIASVKLDTLGTVLINIDMDRLISSATQFDTHYDRVAYILTDKDQVLHHTDNLTLEDATHIREAQISDYRVMEFGGHSYFTVHGLIPDYNWDYYCLVSFNAIAEQIDQAKAACLTVIIIDFLLVLLLSGKLVESLVGHVKRLMMKMRRFADNNTTVPAVDYDYTGREDELGTLHRQFDSMSATIIELIHTNYTSELLKKEAQIKALEHQINPHFLYNTLDSIRWRAKSIGDKNIFEMTEALGLLLRTTLKNTDDAEQSIGEELEVVASYITIQKIRYEERLLFLDGIKPAFYSVRIPKLSIQPLVENAIYYGLEMNVDECSICLSVEAQNDVLHIYVKNTGSEFEENLFDKLKNGDVQPHGHGIGLMNIDKRVRLQYGDDYGLAAYNEDDCAVVRLSIPYMGGANAETDYSR